MATYLASVSTMVVANGVLCLCEGQDTRHQLQLETLSSFVAEGINKDRADKCSQHLLHQYSGGHGCWTSGQLDSW